MTWLAANWRIKLLAVFLAATSWSVVVYAGNPPQSTTIRDVKIEHGPPPAGLVLLHEPEPLNVTIAGLQATIATYKKENIRASVDLTSAKRGPNQLALKVELLDRSVVIRNPQATVLVDLDKVTTVTRKVDVRLIGKPASCCVPGLSVAVPEAVSLTGPESLVQTAVAFVSVDVTDQGVAVQQQATVQIEGLNHKPLAEVSSSPTQVSATVPINNNKLQRNLSISIITTGQVAAGFHVVGIDATPPIVLVEGDPTVFSGVSAVDTDPIDLAGVTGDITRTVNLRPKAGVTVLTKGPFTVKIKIQQDPRVEPSPSPPAAPSPNPSPSPTR